MQKIYVLLRHDQQTGPYSLEELVQFNLKPYDLIWIEGKSAGWYYPQEIGALHPYLPFLPKKQPPAPAVAEKPPVFTAPLSQAYRPKEKTALPATGSNVFLVADTPASVNLEKEVYAQFQPAPPNRGSAAGTKPMPSAAGKKRGQPFAVALAIVTVVGGVFAASWVMNKKPIEPPVQYAATATPAEPLVADVANGTTKKDIEQPAALLTQKKKQANEAPLLRKEKPAATQPVAKKAELQADGTGPVNKPGKSSEPVETELPATTREAETKPTEAPVAAEKKKKLRDKIFDLFKKGPDAQKPAEASPETSEERTASRREEAANLAVLLHVRFSVPNDWMMGIKGATATLVNRSSQTMSKGTINVLYYNDDNELLQKKTIHFGKITAKDSQTIGIPDHPTATRVDYEVVTVTGHPSA